LANRFIGEWNSMLFAAFIPQAWTFLLNILARMDEVKDIFEYWPPPGAMNDFIAPASTNFTGHGGLTFGTNGSSSIKSTNGPTRSQGMLQIVFDCVVVAQAVVWPVYTPFYPPLPMPPPRLPTKPSGKSLSTGSGPLTPQPPAPATPPTTISPPTPTTFAELGNLKVAREDAHFLDLRNTLAEFGIKFTKPPTHFNALIQGCTARKCEFLEQKNVYEDLLVRVPVLRGALHVMIRHRIMSQDSRKWLVRRTSTLPSSSTS
jgi:sacsin